MGWLRGDNWNAFPQLAPFDKGERRSVLQAVAQQAGAAACVRMTLTALGTAFAAAALFLCISFTLAWNALRVTLAWLAPETIERGRDGYMAAATLVACGIVSVWVAIRSGHAVVNGWYRSHVELWVGKARCWSCGYSLAGLTPRGDGSITCPECGRVHLRWQWSGTPERTVSTLPEGGSAPLHSGPSDQCRTG